MKYQPPFDLNFAGPVDGIYNANPDASYVNGNPATGEEGSIPPFESVEHTQRELVHLIDYAGLEPSHEDLEQVRKAVKKMIEDGTDSTALTGGAVAIWEGLRAGTGVHKIRSLKAGANVTITLQETGVGSGEYQIVISSTGVGGGGGGGTLTLDNLGAGAQVYKETVSDVAKLRSVKGADGVSVTQSATEIIVSGAGFGQFFPFFPEVETATGKLGVTGSTGQVVVDTGQTFIHRGSRRIATGDTSAPGRTFALNASKAYHLRWQWNNGSPAYVLKDLADNAYTGGSIDGHKKFDSTFDDMLIALVVTNASNVPTVTTLVNTHILRDVKENTGSVVGPTANMKIRTATETYNWARTPHLMPAFSKIWTEAGGGSDGQAGFSASDPHDHDEHIQITTLTRYGCTLSLMRDYAKPIDVRMLLIA